ncbi:MAG: glycosyltransferase [Nitrospiraceae bacterium]
MSRHTISVVIACVNGLPSIHECLTALERERQGVSAEILVLCCCGNTTAAHIATHFPACTLIHFPTRLGIPELRAIGMARATGEIVSIIEDHCLVGEGWFREILAAHEKGYEAVGGAVTNGSVERLTDWAVFLCEYSGVMPPIPDGEVAGITGNNASYRTTILDRVEDSTKRECWELFLHQELRRQGVKFLSAPSIIVSHKKEFGFWYFMAQRYHYSRSFAGMRRQRTSRLNSLLYACASPLLPGLMLWRMARQVWIKRRHMDKFVLSLPFQAAFMLSYAAGECVGYLFGSGDSLLKVE